MHAYADLDASSGNAACSVLAMAAQLALGERKVFSKGEVAMVLLGRDLEGQTSERDYVSVAQDHDALQASNWMSSRFRRERDTRSITTAPGEWEWEWSAVGAPFFSRHVFDCNFQQHRRARQCFVLAFSPPTVINLHPLP